MNHNISLEEATNTLNYDLNLEKQLENIVNDADIDDLTIEVNDSSKNINLKCNPGFYTHVGSSVLSSLTTNATSMVGDIQVKCVKYKQNLDQGGLEANLVLKFNFSRLTTLLGCVTVHCHNTTRRIQVQGGAVMPSSQTAAVWFCQSFLQPRFQQAGRGQRVNIDSVNTVIRGLSSIPSDSFKSSSCGCCSKLFKGVAKPTSCWICHGTFHKSGCFNRHTCTGTPSRRSKKRIRGDVSSLDESLLVTSQPSSPLLSLIPLPAIVSLSTATTTTATATSSISSTTSSSNALIKPSVLTSFNHFASPSRQLSDPSSQQAVALLTAASSQQAVSLPPSQKPPKPSTKGTKKDTNTFRAEALEKELNICKEKITSQDDTIKDYEEKIKILQIRVKQFEDAQHQELYSRHFPSTTSSSSPEAGTSPPATPTPAPTTCPCHCQGGKVLEELESLKATISTIQIDVSLLQPSGSTKPAPQPLPPSPPVYHPSDLRAPKLGPYRPPSLQGPASHHNPRNSVFQTALRQAQVPARRKALLPTPAQHFQ